MIALVFLPLFFGLAQAATVVTDSFGNHTGINGVQIGASVWNATFLDGNFNDNASLPIIYTESFAAGATAALLDLFSAGGEFSQSAIDLHPVDTFGCTGVMNCHFGTAYGVISSGLVLYYDMINWGGADDVFDFSAASWVGEYEVHDNLTWIKWDENISPVPVPAAIWLMGSGLLGLMGFSRRNKALPAA